MEKKHNSLWLYAAAFLIPCILLLACFWLLGTLPFGEETVMFYDAASQYPEFVGYLRTVFAGENDLFYSFSKNLGGEMVSLFAYYLLSPFSILFLIGTLETLPLVFTGVVVLKTAACGLTFFHAGAKRFGCSWQQLIFSTAYALMAYNTLYGWNIMWIDGVMVLPLLALGLEKLWQGKSSRLYVFSLAYGLLTNFYIGYMLCIAAVLFSLALMFAERTTPELKGRRFGKFVFASCVGGFSSAFAWLPTFLPLLDGRAAAANTTFVWHRTYNILGLAGKLVAGSADEYQLAWGPPHIFCGIFTIMLVVVFFLDTKNSIRKKLLALGVLGVLIGTSTIRGLDEIWHGFSAPNGFTFRYAFIISYVLLTIAQYAWQQRGETSKKCFAISGALVVLLLVGLVGMKYIMALTHLSLTGIAIGAVVVLVTVLYLLTGENPRRFASGLFLAVCLLEMGANYCISIDKVLETTRRMDWNGYQEFLQQTKPAVEAVKSMDTGFYRMEKTFKRSHNDAMLLSYNGLTHFSSSQDKAVPRFLKKLGMTTYQEVWSEYGRETTLAVDSFLGVKYLLSESDAPVDKGYLLRDTANGIGIYENPNVLPIVMVAQETVLAVSPTEESCFSLQNRIWQGLTGQETEHLPEVDEWTLVPENLTETEPGSGIYTKIDPEAEALLTYEIAVTRNLPLYGYFDAPQVQQVGLRINDVDCGSYFSDERWNAFRIGTYAPGETVTISLVPQGQELTVENAWFCYEDTAAVSVSAETIRANPVEIQRDTSSRLSGSYTAREGQILLFTVPYEAGWNLTVDGQETPCSQAAGLFLAARVPQGTHTFALRYTPRGAVAGCALSTGAILVAAAWVLIHRKKKRV